MNRQCEVIIVAGGKGQRMGVERPKAFLPLNDRPIFTYPIEVFADVPDISGIIVVVPSGFEEEAEALCATCKGSEKISAIVPGGVRRQDSVRIGMDQLNRETSLVLIHDAARVFVTEALINRVIHGATETGAVIPGLPVADTLKRIDGAHQVEGTIERRNVVSIQTPQGFERVLLFDAYRHAWENQLAATDDAGLVEALKHPVQVVEGEKMNFKITTPRDLQLALAILKNKSLKEY